MAVRVHLACKMFSERYLDRIRFIDQAMTSLCGFFAANGAMSVDW
jgi:hypothetical protein